MRPERGPRPEMDPAKKRAHELDNAEEITRILESGNEEEVAELMAHIGKKAGGDRFTREDFERFRTFARQRRSLIDRADHETKERVARDPRATDEEYEVGVYHERLEPQVRDAVFALRKKGYAPISSGFKGHDTQAIQFSKSSPELERSELPVDVVTAFEEAGATVFVHDDNVGFTLSEPVSDTELTSLWNALVEALPTLDAPQKPSRLGMAKAFRDVQDRQFGPRSADKKVG